MAVDSVEVPKKASVNYLVPPIIAKALIEIQKRLEPLAKSADNGAYAGATYVPLDEVTKKAHHLLAEYKIAVMQPMVTDDQGHAALETILVHESGKSFSRTTKLAMKDVDPQKHGSAVTYTRRYALMAMIGLTAKDEDDDGNKASGALAPVQQEQLDQIRMLLSLIPWGKEQIDRAVRSIRTKDAADLAIAKYEKLTSEIKRDLEAVANAAPGKKVDVKDGDEIGEGGEYSPTSPEGFKHRLKQLKLASPSFENKVIKAATGKPFLANIRTEKDIKSLDEMLKTLEDGTYRLEAEFYAPTTENILVDEHVA